MFLGREDARKRFLRLGRNSSHFVWLVADLRFFESSNGWVFAYRMQGAVALFALEPLIPSWPVGMDPLAPLSSFEPEILEKLLSEFRVAWKEVMRETSARVAAFVGVHADFLRVLEAAGFQGVQIGQEPWMDLGNCIPRGNAGKGVRSARNQALHSGLSVEEWSSDSVAADADRRAVLTEIMGEWTSGRILQLRGFLNSTDPFAYAHDRRYFVLRSPRRVEAFLVASPVPATGAWFLEDLAQRRDPPRGTGELLTLEAMVALEKRGARAASLGVVSVTTVSPERAKALPGLARFLLVRLPAMLRRFYNFDGMETYRKRFKPRRWEPVHLALAPATGSARPASGRAWFLALWAVLRAFRPRLRATPAAVFSAVSRPLRKYPLTATFGIASAALFAFVNHAGALPAWALARFGFSASAPVIEWPFRSTVSDLLYFGPTHFLTGGLCFFAVLAWAERSHRHRFIVPLTIAMCLGDDIVNYLVLVKPFHYLHPEIFRDLVAVHDVGGSLIMAGIVGLQLCQFRRLREPLLAISLLGVLLALAFTSAKLQHLVMNLDHVLFLVIGFLIGKSKFEYHRHLSRLASKRKPPQATSVRAA